MVTRKSDKSDLFLTRDIRVRVPSKRSDLSAYDQQRAPVNSKSDSDNGILTHDGHISPTIIPNGHIGSESIEASLYKVFISCELLRGRDSGELPTIFRESLNDVYEDILLNQETEYQPPEEFIDILITGIIEADAQDEAAVTISSTDLLYVLEFNKIHMVGEISSPYASIEWPSVQISQALTLIIKDRGLNIFLLNNDGILDTIIAYFFERNPTDRGLDFDEFPEHKAEFLRYAVQLTCINPIRYITKSLLPPLEEIAKGGSIHL